MLIGVVSDTHNNLKNIKKIISLFNETKLELVIHTGDITNSKSLHEFKNLNCEFYAVLGNNDRNEEGLKEVAKNYNFKLTDPPLFLKIKKRKIAVFHEPELINQYNMEGLDLILHGHTHRYREEIINKVVVFNPGESAGFQKGKNAVGIIDLSDLSTKRIFF